MYFDSIKSYFSNSGYPNNIKYLLLKGIYFADLYDTKNHCTGSGCNYNSDYRAPFIN